MTTNQYAAVVPFEAPAPASNALVTSMLARLRRTSGSRTEPGDIDEFLSYGSLLVDHCDSGATVTRPLSPFAWLPISQALQQATQDIRTSGVPVISLFASTAWRLLIASKTIELPSILGGESFASVHSDPLIVLTARLFAQRVQIKDSSSPVISAWRAVVSAVDDEETSSFLSTAVQLSHRTMTARLRESH